MTVHLTLSVIWFCAKGRERKIFIVGYGVRKPNQDCHVFSLDLHSSRQFFSAANVPPFPSIFWRTYNRLYIFHSVRHIRHRTKITSYIYSYFYYCSGWKAPWILEPFVWIHFSLCFILFIYIRTNNFLLRSDHHILLLAPSTHKQTSRAIPDSSPVSSSSSASHSNSSSSADENTAHLRQLLLSVEFVYLTLQVQ